MTWKKFWFYLIIFAALLAIILITPSPLLIGLQSVSGNFLSRLGLTQLVIVQRRWKQKPIYKGISPTVEAICQEWKINPNWLYKLFSVESNFDPKAKNTRTGAAGLWQCMPGTAEYLGISTLSNYSATRQVELITRYWEKNGYKPGDFRSETDLYLANIFPAAVGKPDDWIIQAKDISASSFARNNSLFDADYSGTVTVGEIKQYVKQH